MTNPVGTFSANVKNYSEILTAGAIVTGVMTLVNPVYGAGVGVATMTYVVGQALLDSLADGGAMGKIIKTAGAFFGAVMAGAATFGSLGVRVTYTPAVQGSIIAIGSIFALIEVATR